MNIDDQELIRRVLNGSTDEFRFLVERHQQSIFRFASGLVGNRDEGSGHCPGVIFGCVCELVRIRFIACFLFDLAVHDHPESLR